MRKNASPRVLPSAAIALLISVSGLALAAPAFAQQLACAPVATVDRPPPPLPVYEQPPLPGPGYIWSPGYWGWDEDESDYYWTPGTWVQPPGPGLLWTPGYWAWSAGAFIFHEGYWGPHVGFYGGIDYGYGYTGAGYAGGRWDHGAFFYNRTVNNLGNVNVRNVYTQPVTANNAGNHVSFNGGKGGIEARPNAEDKTYAKERHFAPTNLQQQHVEAASKDPSLFDKDNHGKPPVAATARPGLLKGPNVVPAHAEDRPGAPVPNAAPAEQRAPAARETPSSPKRPAAEERAPSPAARPPEPRQPAAERTPATPPHEPAEEKRVAPAPAREPAEERRAPTEERRATPAPAAREPEGRLEQPKALPRAEPPRPAAAAPRPEPARPVAAPPHPEPAHPAAAAPHPGGPKPEHEER